MVLQDFLGKVVVSSDNQRYVIKELDGAYIEAASEKPGSSGYHSHYTWENGTAPYDNAIARGDLVFQDPTLLAPFRELYETYCRSEEGRLDRYFYWFRKAD